MTWPSVCHCLASTCVMWRHGVRLYILKCDLTIGQCHDTASDVMLTWIRVGLARQPTQMGRWTRSCILSQYFFLLQQFIIMITIINTNNTKHSNTSMPLWNLCERTSDWGNDTGICPRLSWRSFLVTKVLSVRKLKTACWAAVRPASWPLVVGWPFVNTSSV